MGHTAAQTIRSQHAVPSFANAAVDGFALRSTDTVSASPSVPVRLDIAGCLAAGQPPPATTPPQSAWEIMTGAPVPADCDAVLPVERAVLSGDVPGKVAITAPLRPGENRRLAGEDFQPNDLLLAGGDMLNAQAIMALAAVGHDQVPARPPPRMAVLTTGNELLDAGAPRATGRIRDVNGPYLAAALAASGLPLVDVRSAGDDPVTLAREISALGTLCDMIITTGGVSAGKLDFVPATLRELGAKILFHKVAIRPGKPVLCARLPGGPLVLGLPGNPMAVAVGLRFFVLPAARAFMGRDREIFLPARTQADIRARPGLTFFAKSAAKLTEDAMLAVNILPGQESFKISPLLHANCWAVMPEGRDNISAGEIVQVAPLLPGDFPFNPLA